MSILYNSKVSDKRTKSVVAADQVNQLSAAQWDCYVVNPDQAINNLSLGSTKRINYTLDSIRAIPKEMSLRAVIQNNHATQPLTGRAVQFFIESAYLLDSSNNRTATLEINSLPTWFMTNALQYREDHDRDTFPGLANDDTIGYGNNFVDFSVPALGTQEFIVKLSTPFKWGAGRCLLSDLRGARLEINIVANNLTGTPVASDVQLNSCDLLVEAYTPPPQSLSLFAHDPKQKYSYANFELVSVSSRSENTISGTKYIHRLFSAVRPAAMTIICVRPSPVINGSNATTFRAVTQLRFEKNGSRVGSNVDYTPNILNKLNADKLPSWLKTVYPNIYVIAHGELDGMPEGKAVGMSDPSLFDGYCDVAFYATTTEAVQVDVFNLQLKSLNSDARGFNVSDY